MSSIPRFGVSSVGMLPSTSLVQLLLLWLMSFPSCRMFFFRLPMGCQWISYPVLQSGPTAEVCTEVVISQMDLSIVLDFLSSLEFVLDNNPSLLWLTLNASFLSAITSANRVPELAFLSCKELFTTFFKDHMVLTLVLGFVSKVAMDFHLKKEMVLPTFPRLEHLQPHPFNVDIHKTSGLHNPICLHQGYGSPVIFSGRGTEE